MGYVVKWGQPWGIWWSCGWVDAWWFLLLFYLYTTFALIMKTLQDGCRGAKTGKILQKYLNFLRQLENFWVMDVSSAAHRPSSMRCFQILLLVYNSLDSPQRLNPCDVHGSFVQGNHKEDPAPRTPRLSPRSEEGSVTLLSLGCCLQYCLPLRV